jgi:hypothetical protein
VPNPLPHSPTRTLTSRRLAVEVAAPGALYAGSRFDWTGFITQVTLDGTHTFCAPESPTPGAGTGGVGLCNEFGIFTPLGYDDVAPGAPFPKLGVGLCTRLSDDPYSFFTPYPVTPFATDLQGDAHSLTYIQHPHPCAGIAARFTKTLCVAEDRLTIQYRLENVGDRPIVTEEYIHNFLAIDGLPLGPGYQLRLPESAQLTNLPTTVAIDGTLLRWHQGQEQTFYCPIRPCTPAQPVTWEFAHTGARAGVRGTESFPVARFALFGTPHLVSPECFLALALAPGTSQEWTRAYTFFGE